MTRIFLIASVAALAITSPAQADFGREDRGQRAERAQQSEERRAERRSKRQQASERRSSRQQASERRASRPQASERRASRQQALERRTSRREAISERRAGRQQVKSDRRSRIEQRQSDRGASRQQQASDRRSRFQQRSSDRRSQAQQIESNRRSAIQQARSDRRSRVQQVESDRRSRLQQIASDRRSRVQQERSDRRRAFSGDRRERIRDAVVERFSNDRSDFRRLARQRQRVWEQRAENLRERAEWRQRLRQRRFARFDDDDRDDRRRFRSVFRVGDRVNRNWWYDDYVPLRYRARFHDNDRFYYRYDGDYLYRLRRNDNVVLSLFPLLGGAYSVGRPLPFYTSSYYNVPYGYSSLYYDTPDYYYRYGDGAIYQVDPTTQLIAGVVALLTGQNFGIGQRLPLGYDTYNVPYVYRSRYFDTNDRWYRYDDGYIYGVDPRTRLIQTSYPVYGGYAVGNPWPSYAGHDYGVPSYYDDLYYAEPGYDYRFASGGIYAVDPKTQLVAALAALVTGQNFAVGQPLPIGYDTYNVPFAYRDRYFDDDDDWYRYADGRILQVDPRTRIIRRAILV